ncbi:hypothetical protein BCU68_11140 [Vibrio sp. 10N.286.49.B3]|uniref:flagellar sheath protein A n=1 Tax=Vibrio sp. 10N.286.49.B3 TaxID=1880855 RepID=UPI000C8222BE|nr:flagellar sheath protein A [Vibrio sp. 10N.286.49.B3]PMH44991.1 hypothetical protein BCU68_11140 [Vibrio sp. 10N.286.49.B3]
MKNLKMLPLAAVVATSLVGCGSDSSSDGGGGYTPENITLEFIQLESPTNNEQVNCTAFDVNESDDGTTKYTYANVATDVTILIHGDNGEVIEVKAPDSSGKLVIDKKSLEDDSFISILDYPGSNNPYYKALSIQKELLISQLIKVGRPQGVNSACYSKNEMRGTQSGTVLSITGSEVSINGFQYLSTFGNDGITTANQVNITAFNDEAVLVKGFNNKEFNSYSFAEKLTENERTDAELEPLDSVLNWSNQLPLYDQLNLLQINIAKGNYIYDWAQPDVETEENFSITSAEDTWFYHAEVELESEWTLALNDKFETTLDIMQPDSLTIGDGFPEIQSIGNSAAVDMTMIYSTNRLIARNKYTQSYANNTETLQHVIISENSDGLVLIPNLDLENLSAMSPDSLETTLFEVDGEVSASSVQYLLSAYEEEDVVSAVVAPSQWADFNYQTNTAKYSKLFFSN